MEKRTLLAVVLSLIVLIGWSFFQKKTMPPQKIPQEKPVQPPEAPPTIQPEKKEDISIPHRESVAVGEARNVVIESDLYKAVLSTRGAIVTYWELKEFRDKQGMPVVVLRDPGVIPPLSIILNGPDRHMPQKIIYQTNVTNLDLTGRQSRQGEVIFSYKQNGISIEKKFVFHSDTYRVDLVVAMSNTPSFMITLGTDFGVFDREQREHKGPVLLHGADREEFDESLKSSKYFTENVHWIAQEDKYFTAALIPRSPVDGATVWKEATSAEIAFNVQPHLHTLLLYVGPKEYDKLREVGAGLEHMVDFGWFAFIAMPLFWVLKFFYTYLGNYGWAIILLTIIVRIPFIPIMNKSQKSMKKMQKIQPLMAELKEKYKNDSQKMQKEMMAIYKKHKVNPVGGCLPMLLQIPVFIALYNVLLKAIELRGAPFALWITDLAARDPYYVLPIVMGLTMVLQQKMTPTAMDPKQAKIMMMMPIIFTFMFLTFPSGLVLYWLVNNILGIGQQYYANKKAE